MSGLLVIIVFSWIIGGPGASFLGLRGLESLVLRLYLGLAACAVLIMLAGSYSLGVVNFALGGLVIASFALSRLSGTDSVNIEEVNEDLDVFGFLERVCLGASAATFGLMLIAALAPATSWDAGVAHLALPSDYVRDGRIHLLNGNVYSAYPQALHCLFAYLFYMSGERGVMLLCWVLSILACATLYVLAKRLADRRSGILAVAFLASAPIFISQSGTVAIDLPFAGATLAVLWCLVVWRQRDDVKWLVAAGFLAGYACGIRHTGYVATALCTVGVLIESRKPRTALIFLAVAAVAASPWYLRSYALVGNPVYPLLEPVFEQDVFARHQVTEFGAHETISDTSVFGFVLYSWDLVMHPDNYDGWGANPGGWVWILGIPGLFMGGRVARWIGLFCLAGISSFYMVQRFARYAVAFYVPMLAVAGAAGSRLSDRSRALSGFIIGALIYGCVLTAGSMYFKVPVVLGMESREEYLLRRVDRYEAFAWVNEHVPDDGTVLTLDLRSYYIDRPTFQNINELYVLTSMNFDEKVAWFSDRGIRYLVLPDDVIQRTPLFEYMGLQEEFESWKDAPDYFHLLDTLEIPRAREEGSEQITVYEVLAPESGSE